jgi:hypothetical protein
MSDQCSKLAHDLHSIVASPLYLHRCGERLHRLQVVRIHAEYRQPRPSPFSRSDDHVTGGQGMCPERLSLLGANRSQDIVVRASLPPG